MLYLSLVVGQIVLVVLTIATLLFILKASPVQRAQRFQQSLPYISKISLGLMITLFVVGMVSFLPFTSPIIFAVTTLFLWFTGLWLPFKSYSSLFKKDKGGFVSFIFVANILLNAAAISFILQDSFHLIPSNGYSELFFGAIATMVLLWIVNLICHLAVHLIYNVKGVIVRKGFPSESRSQYTSDKIQAYHDAGLTNEDITYFREQMAPVRDNIFQLEKSINQTAKLRSINQRHQIIATCQDYFRSIVKEPTRIGEAGTFIYKLLPNITDLVDKYNEINGHVAKNKQTYLILERSAQMIERIGEEIHDDYIQFHQTTYQALDDEIAYAERLLNDEKHDNETQQNHSHSSLDDLINEMNDFLNE